MEFLFEKQAGSSCPGEGIDFRIVRDESQEQDSFLETEVRVLEEGRRGLRGASKGSLKIDY